MRVTFDPLSTAHDMGASFNSNAQILDYSLGYSIHGIIAGAPVGSISLEGSNDPVPGDLSGASVVNWLTIADSTQLVTGAGEVFWNYNGCFYKWVRVAYVRTSGTGTITLNLMGKGF